MDIVKQLIQEVNHLSNVHGPHWGMTEYEGTTRKISEGSGSTTQMIHMIAEYQSQINDGLYVKYPKGRFIHNEAKF